MRERTSLVGGSLVFGAVLVLSTLAQCHGLDGAVGVAGPPSGRSLGGTEGLSDLVPSPVATWEAKNPTPAPSTSPATPVRRRLFQEGAEKASVSMADRTGPNEPGGPDGDSVC